MTNYKTKGVEGSLLRWLDENEAYIRTGKLHHEIYGAHLIRYQMKLVLLRKRIHWP